MVNEIMKFINDTSSEYTRYAYRNLIIGIGEKGIDMVVRFRYYPFTTGTNVSKLLVDICQDAWNDHNPGLRLDIEFDNSANGKAFELLAYHDNGGGSVTHDNIIDATAEGVWHEVHAVWRLDNYPSMVYCTDLTGIDYFEKNADNISLGRYNFLTLHTTNSIPGTPTNFEVDWVKVREIQDLYNWNFETDNHYGWVLDASDSWVSV